MNITDNGSILGGEEQVILESREEMVISLAFIFLPVLVAVISQLLVIVSIVRTPSLHEPHFYILLTCCVADMVTALLSATGKGFIFRDGAQKEWMCGARLPNPTLETIVLGTTLNVAVVAYERFVYFVQPFKYLQSFTTGRIMGYAIAPYLVSAVWAVITEFTHGRTFHASVLGCELPIDPLLLGIKLSVFLAPPTVMSIYTIVRVLRLTRNITPDGTSASVPASAAASVPASATPVHQIRRAVRMMLLLSGAFWLSVVPGHVAHIAIFTSGITWADVDSRRNRAAGIVMRIVVWLYIWLPPALNPFIYLYSRKDLRNAMRKMLCGDRQINPQ